MANVLETSMNYLQTQDPEVAACIENEFQRQKQNIELIASENIASPAVIAAMGSVLTNKYAEGYPGKRYYGGCDYVDVLETLAMERAKKRYYTHLAHKCQQDVRRNFTLPPSAALQCSRQAVRRSGWCRSSHGR